MSKNKRKDRSLIYSVAINEDTNIVWNESERRLELRDSKGKLSSKNFVNIGHSYFREGKSPKILRQGEYLKGMIHFEPVNVLSDRYFAIDTNYELFGENYLCVTSCHSLEGDVPEGGDYVKGDKIKILQWPRLVFLAKQGTKPERYGWKKYIESLIISGDYLNDKSYCAIVDSDLKDIPKINAREIPIHDDFYLPARIQLQYASADTGNENLQNKFIRQTDRVAKKSIIRAKKEFEQLATFSFDTYFHDLTTYNGLVTINMSSV